VKDIHDIIKQTKFGDDRLRGSGVVAGQISAFPIDFAGRPYNTLTLPCERVITLFLLHSGNVTYRIVECLIIESLISDDGIDFPIFDFFVFCVFMNCYNALKVIL